MAVYNKLLLSTGGGIISKEQQAEQAEDAVSIFIGLGGTGISCLSEVKKQVYSRVKPDPDSGAIPEYKHIRFLAVDTDNQSKDSEEVESGFSTEETFGILGAANIAGAALNTAPHLQWVNEEVRNCKVLTGYGAGGIRQVGRYLIMSHAEEFRNKLQKIIDDARKGTSNRRIAIHIFSGLCGGTGSGTFLDICYIIKDLVKTYIDRNGTLITDVLGYFFMPDVNISKSDQTYLKSNGYAALQELDYCMNLERNGGAFIQQYVNNRSIEWKEAPVDFCHLISATNNSTNVRNDTYHYGMRAVSEYVLNYLIKMQKNNGEDYNLKSHLNNVNNIIFTTEAKRTAGYNLRYLTIGGAGLTVPVREINTCLVSKLYQRFSMKQSDIPKQEEVAVFSLNLFSAPEENTNVIERLKKAIIRDMTREGVNNAFVQFDGKASEVSKGNEEFKEWYEHQLAVKKGICEKNKEKLLDENNQGAYITNAKVLLMQYAREINRGAIYACNVLSSSMTDNFYNIIAGLQKTFNEMLSQEKTYEDQKFKRYKKAEEEFLKNKGLFGPSNSKYKEYEERTAEYHAHLMKQELYEQILKLLNELNKQIKNLEAEIFSPLSAIFYNLRQTFAENLKYIDYCEETNVQSNEFVRSMISMNDDCLKTVIDEAVAKISPETVYAQLVDAFVANPKAWKSERAITGLVNQFFVDKESGIFKEFSGKTIEEYLALKYQTTDISVLKQKITAEYINPTINQADSLFACNAAVYNQNDSTLHDNRVFIPVNSPSINAAVNSISSNRTWQIISSVNEDRMVFMTFTCAFPICSFLNIDEYRRDYYNQNVVGKHYYEGGRGNEDKPLPDWRELPPLLPLSKFDGKEADLGERWSYIATNAKKICEDVKMYNLTDIDGFIYQPSDEYIDTVNRLYEEVIAFCASKESDVTKITSKKCEFESRLAEIGNFSNRLVKTADKLDMAGDVQKYPELIKMDAIGYSPIYQKKLSMYINILKNLEKKIEETNSLISEMETNVNSRTIEMNSYTSALFTGVIRINGLKVEYVETVDGMEMDSVILSELDANYKYEEIPVYQAFLSYQALSDDVKQGITKAVKQIRKDMDMTKDIFIKLDLSKKFSEKNIHNWRELGKSNYPSEAKAITEFVMDFKKQLATFCTMYELEI